MSQVVLGVMNAEGLDKCEVCYELIFLQNLINFSSALFNFRGEELTQWFSCYV